MNENRGLITTMIIIGVVIVILLIAPGYRPSTYAYRGGNVLTASTVSIDPYIQQSSRSHVSSTGYYTIERNIPRTSTYTYSYPAPTTTYTTYSYPQPQSYTYSYPQQQYQNQGGYFSDGCSITSAYSITTGQLCS